MNNFESVKSGGVIKKVNKWHLFWVLFLINLVGFAAARFYFQEQEQGMKADTEVVDFNNKYGASVHEANTLLSWGFELLRLIRGRD